MTPDPNARRRALQLLASQVGPGPAMPFQPVDLAALAPAPDMDTEGLRTERFAGQIEAPSEEELLRQEEAGLRTRSSVGNIAADLGQSTSRAIETITGAPGSKVYGGMRERSSEPLKAFLRAQEAKARGPAAQTPSVPKPTMTDEQARASIRALYPDASEEAINATTALNYEATRKSLEGTAGRGERSGRFTEGMEARKREAEARAEALARREGLEWAKMDLQERLARERIEENRLAREEARALKEQARLDALVVPGAEIDPAARPTPKDAETVKGVLTSAKRLGGAIGEMRALHTQYGPSLARLSGPAGVRLRQAITGIQLEAKNIAELGALSGPDQGLMEALAGGDPTSIEAAAKSFFGVDSTVEAMNGLERWMNNQVAATLEARGYRMKTAAAPRRRPDQVLPQDASGQPTLAPSARLPVKETLSKDRKWKRITYSDGTTETVPNGQAAR